MKKGNHLSMFGVGPIYVAVIIYLTSAAVVCGHFEFFKAGLIPIT